MDGGTNRDLSFLLTVIYSVRALLFVKNLDLASVQRYQSTRSNLSQYTSPHREKNTIQSIHISPCSRDFYPVLEIFTLQQRYSPFSGDIHSVVEIFTQQWRYLHCSRDIHPVVEIFNCTGIIHPVFIQKQIYSPCSGDIHPVVEILTLQQRCSPYSGDNHPEVEVNTLYTYSIDKKWLIVNIYKDCIQWLILPGRSGISVDIDYLFFTL